MKLSNIFTILALLVIINVHGQAIPNAKASINLAIKNMVKGKDMQDGAKIALGFWDDAAIFATRGSDILTVPLQQFIDLHQSKKLGGHNRTFEVKSLTINPSGIASALVVAQDQKVHYEYHLGFTLKKDQWRIQTYLQHSFLKK